MKLSGFSKRWEQREGWRYVWVMGTVLLIELAVCFIHELFTPDGNPWVAVVWALAWLGLGAVPGFLFGVPRVVLQESTEKGREGQGRVSHLANTNLEQISDWLTKLLIGVGLVQLGKVPGALQVAAGVIAAGLGRNGTSFALALILLFSITGFLAAYLITRLYLARAFREADVEVVEDTARKKMEEMESMPQRLDDSSLTSSEVRKVAEQIARIPLEEVRGGDMDVWAKAHLILRDIPQAVRGYRLALEVEPGSAQLHLEFASALYHGGRLEEARHQLLLARDRLEGVAEPGSVPWRVYSWLLFLCLWMPPPRGFEEAITFGEEFLLLGYEPGEGSFYVNLASAYGQKQQWLLENQGGDEEKAATRSRALECVRLAVRANKGMVRRLTELLVKGHPGKNPQDDDLEMFEHDDEFREVLGLPRKAPKAAVAA